MKLNARVATHRVAVTDRAGIQSGDNRVKPIETVGDTVKVYLQSVTERVDIADKPCSVVDFVEFFVATELVLDVSEGVDKAADTRNGPADLTANVTEIVGQQVGTRCQPIQVAGALIDHSRRAAQPVANLAGLVCRPGLFKGFPVWPGHTANHGNAWDLAHTLRQLLQVGKAARGSQVVCRVDDQVLRNSLIHREMVLHCRVPNRTRIRRRQLFAVVVVEVSQARAAGQCNQTNQAGA